MKFKVGDKVKFNKGNEVVAESYDYNPKKTYEVIETMEETGTVRIINELGKKLAFSEWRFDLYKPKPTKKQRIAALEERTAKQDEEIAELKTIVHQLRESNITIDDVKRHFDIKATPSIVEDKPKTANELRAEIIEKAKQFIEDTKETFTGRIKHGEPLRKFENVYSVRKVGISKSACNAEFIVNEEKRTIVVLLRGVDTNKVHHRGIAKCMPGDVFNSHIGKTIALGRALGLDVSEFEQAVQPTFAIGQKVHYKSPFMTGFEGDYEIKGFEYGGDIVSKGKGVLDKKGATIINDTNAIYSSEVK